MKRVIRISAVLLAIVVSACATREQIEGQAAIPPYPEPYREALQNEFRALALRELEHYDYSDARRFMLRAKQAARAGRGQIPPLTPDDYHIEPEVKAELTNARARLMTLFDGGRARAPASLARAHAMFECWLEESEEGHQSDDIAWCRKHFEDAVAATRRDSGLDADWGLVLTGDGGHVGAITLSGKAGEDRLLDMADAAGFVHEAGDARDAALTKRENSWLTTSTMAFMPPPAAVYVVYFASGRADLSEDARAAIAAAAEDAAGRKAVDVEILGFADRAGGDAANIALSERRAAAVKDALAELDVPEDAFLVYARGEDTPAVDTADGVAEARNRRVEITVR